MLRRPRLFFFALALLLWTLNRLAAPDQEAILSFKANFSGFPKAQQNLGLDPLPERVSLRLHARGFELLGLALRPGRSISFDLPQDALASAADSVAWVDWAQYKDDIRKQLPASVALLSVENRPFSLRFRTLKNKMLPVECALPRSWGGRYRLEDLRIEPDSVRVFGSSAALSNLRALKVLWPVSQRSEPQEALELTLLNSDSRNVLARPDRVLVRSRPVKLSSSVQELRLPKPAVVKGLRSVLSPAHSSVYSTGSLESFEEWSEAVPKPILNSDAPISEPGVYTLKYRLPEAEKGVERRLSIAEAKLYVFRE